MDVSFGSGCYELMLDSYIPQQNKQKKYSKNRIDVPKFAGENKNTSEKFA